MKQKNKIFIPIIILGLLTLTGLYIYYTPNRQQATNETKNIQKKEETSVQDNKVKLNGWVEYTNQPNNYKIEYPNTWKYENVNDTTIKITSPDFKMSQGYPVLLNGAQVYVFAQDTTEPSAQSSFDNDPLASDIATNFSTTTLGGLDAVQYDISYEGTVATITKAVKDGKMYTIQFRYPSKEEKLDYKEIMRIMFDSFEINKK